MSMIQITIDGKVLQGNQGETILQIAQRGGVMIPTLCHDDSVKHYGACGLCVVEAEGVPKLLRSCSTAANDGMVIHTDTERVKQSRKIALELLMSDHDGDCVGPCSLNCPAGTNCQGYLKQIALGDDKEAVRIIKEKLPFPASIGRVCPHPCEDNCRRRYVEEPLSIAYLKYFAADNVRNADNDPCRPAPAAATGKTVGIIGGGPAGLTAAYFLALKGHTVTVYDAMPQMGGMLRYGIPAYRLPKDVLDAEIADVEALGVKLVNHFKIGQDETFDAFRARFDAVIVAIGAWRSTAVGCAGDTLPGVVGGIDLLQKVALGERPNLGKHVAIVGGGNTAMDACRTAVRLGAEDVTVVYRRTRAEMPAEDLEIEEAMEEGVQFHFLAAPAEIIADESGKAAQLKLQIMELGEPDASGRRAPVPVEGKFEVLPVDTVIAAIGQKVNPAGFDALELNKRGIIAADEATFRTNLDNVFAVGDATNKGAGIAIAAIGEANKAAEVVDSYLNGAMVGYRAPYVSEREVDESMFAQKERIARIQMPTRPAEERKKDFLPVNIGFDEALARAEAKRCLECGCHDYGECKLVCYADCCGAQKGHIVGEKHGMFTEQKLVSIERNQGKCILCGLCVRVCDEVAKKGLLGLVGRGFTTVIKPEFNDPAVIAGCKDCRKCVEACPTGALKLLG